MAMQASNGRQSYSGSSQPSYTTPVWIPTTTSTPSISFSKSQAATVLGVVGLVVGLLLAIVLWIASCTVHWAFAWEIGQTATRSLGWWIGWPSVVAILGVIGGVILGD